LFFLSCSEDCGTNSQGFSVDSGNASQKALNLPEYHLPSMLELVMMKTFDPSSPQLAVITGAAVRLGKAIAMELADQHYAIGLHYHHSSKAAADLAESLSKNGTRVLLLKADLTDAQQIEKMFSEIKDSAIPLGILVNSASIMTHVKIQDMSVDQWDQTMQLNLRAPWLCTRFAAEIMKDQGHIINITDSGSGRLWTNYAAYSISKAGLEVFTRMAAKSLAPHIRVNAIAPGLVLPPEGMPAADWEKLVRKLPSQKAGSPEDIARAVRFLVENEHITGHTLQVDGGYHLVST
jgi:NAD(P)-dependent dehydrogenase (short-subunit alcohol dehydrogenase family)